MGEHQHETHDVVADRYEGRWMEEQKNERPKYSPDRQRFSLFLSLANTGGNASA